MKGCFYGLKMKPVPDKYDTGYFVMQFSTSKECKICENLIETIYKQWRSAELNFNKTKLIRAMQFVICDIVTIG